mmetsp:Transcript_20661/g.47263  ORF Transcript_20661/g.47263 Transcript_20661/m.47263 type:complete len:298 (+) Transcript_20661:1-894(+)
MASADVVGALQARDYKLTDRLLFEAGATTVTVAERSSGFGVAVKLIQKGLLRKKEEENEAREEMRLHEQLRHPAVLPLLFSEETPAGFLLVSPLAVGNLYDATRFAAICEADSRRLAEHLLHAMVYLHDLEILHNDLKPHNVLMVKRGETQLPQLADFGMSLRLPSSGLVPFTGLKGSSGYYSPEEMAEKSYGAQADVFSLGVMIFEVLAGYEPFCPKHTFFEPVEIDDECWEGVTPPALELVTEMLRVDPAKRWTAKQALDSPWFKGTGGAAAGMPPRLVLRIADFIDDDLFLFEN